jgi:hypothetical protein
MNAPVLRSGFQQLEEAVNRQKQGFTPPAGKLNYFSLDPGEKITVRFLDDAIVTTKFYEWIVNNQGETSEFILAPDLYQFDPNWQGQDWVAKWRSPQPGIGWEKPWQSNELKEPKPKERTVGMAVLLEPDEDEAGNRIPGKFRDKLDYIDVDGEKHVSLHFMLVRQALSNFWDQMVGFHGLYGTICDRPYQIERRGEKLKTTYQAIGLDRFDDWDPADKDGSMARLHAYYGYGIKVSDPKSENFQGNPEGYTWENRFLYCPTTVAEWCERRASEDYAAFWLDPNAEHLKDKPKAGGVTAEGLLATQRPADPRKAAAPAAPAVPAAQAVAPTPPPVADAPVADAAVPAAPVSGDRFEAMRKEMAERQAKTPAAT